MAVQNAKELRVYQLSYNLAMYIFKLSNHFPSEEKFALTSQIRRSSRSISMNLPSEGSKRRYEAHFVSKLTDCDGENGETETSLDFALDCGYITPEQHQELVSMKQEIGRMLGSMLNNPKQWLLTTSAAT